MSRRMDPHRWEAIRAAFDHLVGLDPAGRVRGLTAVGTGDPELRLEVNALLVADAEADARLAPIDALLSSSAAAEPLNRLIAALAERYDVTRLLGRGGMATVHLARDLKHDRLVALKVLRTQFAAGLGAERFLQEVRITARLTHPHILPLLDSGAADGFLFYVTPYIAGESLRDRLNRDKQLPLEDALGIAREVADALSYAHSQGVVHRDIKPENIMLEGGHAVVADFGIARAFAEAGGERLTETGVALGTPAYMSPEQAEGSPQLDGRSDLYSLGCVLFEMLAGMPPFSGPTAESIVRQHLAADPPSLSNIRAAVPESIARSVQKALSKTPADRYASAGAFLASLSTSYPQSRWVPLALRKTGRFVVAGAAAVLLATAVFLGSRSTLHSVLPRVVVMPFENLTGNGALNPVGVAVSQSVVDELASSGTFEILPAGELGANVSFKVGGSIRQRGDSIEFVTEIVDQARHRVLPAPEPTRVSLRDPLAKVETVCERAAGALGYYTNVFGAPGTPQRRPPSYPAYLAFSEGVRQMLRLEPDSGEAAFRRAIALDPSYTEAYLLLAGFAFWNQPGRAARRGGLSGRFDAMDSLAHVMRETIKPLTEADRIEIQILEDWTKGDLAAGLTASARLAEWLPSAEFGVGFQGVWANRPRIALDRLRRLNPDEGWLRDWSPYWLFLAAAYHEVGDYVGEDRATQRGLERFPQDAAIVEVQLRAATALGHLDVVRGAIHELPLDEVLRLAMEERAHGYTTESDRLLTRVVDSFDSLPPDHSTEAREDAAAALSLLGRHREAIGILEALARRDTIRLDLKGMLGVAYAMQGDTAAADRVSQDLAAVREGLLYGLPTLWRARIAAVQGHRARAVELLHQALGEGTRWCGVWGEPGCFWHSDPAFESLHDYAPYQALLRP